MGRESQAQSRGRMDKKRRERKIKNKYQEFDAYRNYGNNFIFVKNSKLKPLGTDQIPNYWLKALPAIPSQLPTATSKNSSAY
jgi:hypothetical protein